MLCYKPRMSRWVVCAAAWALALAGCDDGSSLSEPDTAIIEAPPALTNVARAEFRFENRGNANNFICRVDGAAWAVCLSPFVTTVVDGEHTFQVAAALNNLIDETPASHTWRVDTVPPETTLLAGPPALDNATSPVFTFSGTDDTGEVTFECALDGGAFAACTSPHTATVTADGAHTLTVRAVDEAGNVDPEPPTHAWTLDTSAPDTTITAGPDAGATTAATGAFEFESNAADATFECAFDGAAFTPCTSPRAFDLGDGAHVFAVRAVNALGVVDPSPASRAWTVDATPPTVAITQAPPNPSNDPAPAIRFESPDATATFACAVDGGAFAACTSPHALAGLADGSHTFTVRPTDPVGNVGAPASHTWVVDTVPPTVVITGGPTGPTNNTTPTFTFTTGGDPATTRCRIVGVSSPVDCTAGTFTPAVLADGARTFEVVVTDAAGNAATATRSFTVDTVPPTVTITGGPTGPTNNTTPTFTFTTGGDPATTRCRIVGVSSPVDCTAGTFTPAVLADGARTFEVVVTDAAGNAATATRSFTVDTVPPTVTITGGPTGPTNNTTPTFTFTTGGDPATTRCRIVGVSSPVDCTAGTFTPAVLADGARTFEVVVTDAAGNAATATRSFTVDTVPPTVTITGGPTGPTNNTTPTFTFTTGGDPATTRCRIVGVSSPVDCTAGTFTPAVLADGARTFEVVVTDAAGNAATATRSFTVDTVPPTVTITGGPTGPTNNTTPTFTFTTGGDPATTRCRIVGVSSPVDCTAGTFTPAVLADGARTFEVVVTDAAGNAATATRSFTVDTVPPTVTITGGPTGPTNNTTPTFTFTTGGDPATTRCRIVGVSSPVDCTAGTFTPAVLADGARTFEVVVTDAAGNAATATRSFTVDVTPPTITITGGPTGLTNIASPVFTFTASADAATVTCRIGAATPVSCAGGSFTATGLADGPHTFQVTATDAAGNAASATRSFTRDTTPPTVIFDEVPPAGWPVNYFDFAFRASEPATFECSVNGGTFAACTSPRTVTGAAYAAQTFAVRARDTAGNLGSSASRTWTPTRGLVLHYPWEQASTDNTSLLALVPALSPNGAEPTASSFVGGWAGSALGRTVAEHKYPGTIRPLTSAPDGRYTVSFWVRATNDALGTVLTTMTPTGGLRVSIEGQVVIVRVRDTDGKEYVETVRVALNRWVSVVLRTAAANQGPVVFVNGIVDIQVPGPANGFGPTQAETMLVGPFNGFDLDDLRFFNTALTDEQVCTVVGRGVFEGGKCSSVLAPGFELDFEDQKLTHTGTWSVGLLGGAGNAFVSHALGGAMRLTNANGTPFIEGIGTRLRESPGRSISFSFVPHTAFGSLIDLRGSCPPSNFACGLRISYPDNGTLVVYAGTVSNAQTRSFSVPVGRLVGVLVTEQRVGQITQQITVYINGQATVIPLGGGDIFVATSFAELVTAIGMIVDEYEIWPADLSREPQMLCENGLDGEFERSSNRCLLTAH